MFNREEMDWNIYQYYDVKMFRPDSSEGFLQPSSSLAALNDSEDIMKTMIKRERNRVAATKCRYRHEVNPIFEQKKSFAINLGLKKRILYRSLQSCSVFSKIRNKKNY